MMKVEIIVSNDIAAFEKAVNAFVATHDVIDVQYRPVTTTKTMNGMTMTMVNNRAMIVYVVENEYYVD